ncbi:MAG: PHP domain-containing protein [Candidatus Glassbacteria bacterium]|nr:PHP domain-containing protein [Candidatus Glassbacteria bacterium]
MRADLHIHSNYSDGSFSPEEIFSRAVGKGLGIISITDHDTVDHIQPSLEQADKTGVVYIPGVEFSASTVDRDVHLLGYALDHLHHGLLEYLDLVRKRRVERAHQILELLRRQDIVIPPGELDSLPGRRIISRPLIAQLMIKYKYVGTLEEAFVRYLRPGTPAYVPYKLADPGEVVGLITDCGGISVLAHPSAEEFETLAPGLCRAGLQGVEVFRPRLGESESRLIADGAQARGLVLTGGSDWHFDTGALKLGDFFIEEERIRPFLELMERGR